MSSYKVKLGEEIVTVDGLAGLVKLVQEGRLSPEDPVFIPSTNRWHYARSVRQLREYFPGTPEPPRETPRSAPANAPSEKQQEEGAGAQVLRLRKGKWSPEGRIEVPIFSYSVDADPPPAFKWFRLFFSIAIGTVLAFFVWLYITGYSRYMQGYEEKVAADLTPVFATPTPAPRETRASRTVARAEITDAPDPAPTAVAVAAAGAPLFDEAAALEKVLTARVTAAAKPADLGDAIEKDLTRLAVPVRSVAFAPRPGAKGSAVPFVGVVEYVRGEKIDDASAARHRFMIVAMIGRRANEVGLRLDSVRFATTRGKGRTAVEIPADLARRIADGSAPAADLDALR